MRRLEQLMEELNELREVPENGRASPTDRQLRATPRARNQGMRGSNRQLGFWNCVGWFGLVLA